MKLDQMLEDKLDIVTCDVPLFIRMLEFAREDAKNDMALHKVVENALLLMRQHDVLKMKQYNKLIKGAETKSDK